MNLDTALRITTPFGGGMGRTRQMCGAVGGGLMAIGLPRGTGTRKGKPKKDARDALTEVVEDAARITAGLLGVERS